MPKILITTVPFANSSPEILTALVNAGIDYEINPLGRKLKENELADMIADFDGMIAGTEPITAQVLNCARNLKFISRVGIGLDNVDLITAQKRGIKVSYTPDAPAPAVAELTLGLIFSLLRSIHRANENMHQGTWQRFFGRRISHTVFGIIGAGRIGGQVVRNLSLLGAKKILLNDIADKSEFLKYKNVELCSKQDIYKKADLISLHLPLTTETRNLIGTNELELMRTDTYVINTARGGIINENALAVALENSVIAGAAIDVFDQEPYVGKLIDLHNCLLTSHMGSMSYDCRDRMEIEATEELIRFFSNVTLHNEVPEEEFQIKLQGLKNV